MYPLKFDDINIQPKRKFKTDFYHVIANVTFVTH